VRGEDPPQHRRQPWSAAACALVGLQRRPDLPLVLLGALGRAFCPLVRRAVEAKKRKPACLKERTRTRDLRIMR